MKLRRRLLAIAAAVGLAVGGFTVATPAHALTLHGYCGLYDACLYYRINYQGAVTGTPDRIDDYFSPNYITFLGPNDWNNSGNTDGRGRAVGNATGSYFNYDPDFTLQVFEHRCVGATSTWGRSDIWAPWTGSGSSQFVTRNNNRCQTWF